MRIAYLLILGFLFPLLSFGQVSWQQRIEYDIDVKLDAEKNTYNGTQTLVYENNSPDDLKQVFFHLYFNAFQPGSMMDVRSRSILDPDPRVGDRISKLSKDEIGRLEVLSMEMNGQPCTLNPEGTILQVGLPQSIPAGEKVTFTVKFDGQVPLQVRRSGRDNKEGIRFSMSQWYPKMCEYDHRGWHSNPYIGREFHGVWGNFDVKITLDPSYTIASTGVLQNKAEIGHGYTDQEVDHTGKESITWHFKGENIHDFVWAADPDYKHVVLKGDDIPELHFFYQEGEETAEWSKLPEFIADGFRIMNKRVGKYPYPVYSVVQGGDGGMEYPMATLITGHRRIGSLIGVTVHEMIHSWFQGMLATNEALYPWMDEGFTSYFDKETTAELLDNKTPHLGSYKSYFAILEAGLDEAMTIHADHYQTNYGYGINAYAKGNVLLHQLSYVVGQEAYEVGMKDYFETFKFHHPEPNDFKRCMEKASGLELDWYFEYFVHTRHTIDYAIGEVDKSGKSTTINLMRKGVMPMPMEVVVTQKDGSQSNYYIPLRIMRGEKKADGDLPLQVQEDWPWTNTEYALVVPFKRKTIVKIEIDPSGRVADVKAKNNVWEAE